MDDYSIESAVKRLSVPIRSAGAFPGGGGASELGVKMKNDPVCLLRWLLTSHRSRASAAAELFL